LTSPNGKVYIGKTKDFRARMKYHKLASKKGKTHLYLAIRKYGWENFSKEIIDHAETEEELSKKEIYWIAYYQSINPVVGYNMSEGGTGGDTWSSLSQERKAEAISKRPPMSDETKKKVSRSLKERYKTQPHHSLGGTSWNKGLKEDPELTEKKRLRMLGTKDSEETRKRKSQALKGKNTTPKSESHRQKLSESLKGRSIPEETRKKMSQSRKGKTFPTIICPYCGKEGAELAMLRWHFENCKSYLPSHRAL
jgi:group I intron endonuclease